MTKRKRTKVTFEKRYTSLQDWLDMYVLELEDDWAASLQKRVLKEVLGIIEEQFAERAVGIVIPQADGTLRAEVGWDDDLFTRSVNVSFDIVAELHRVIDEDDSWDDIPWEKLQQHLQELADRCAEKAGTQRHEV